MKKVRLDDVCEVIAGQSPPSEFYNQEGKGLPFFQGKADFNELYPTVRYWCEKPTKIALPNDVLLSIRAPVGPTNLCNQKSCIGRGLSAIRAGENVDYKYLLFFFRAIEPKLSAKGRGSTFAAINQEEIREIEFPIIPLPEQQKIAAILSQVDAAREKRKQANALTDQFLQSTFLTLFGDPVKNEKGWEVCKVIDVCDCIVPGRDKPKSFSGNIPWVTTDDLNDLGITENSKKKIGLSGKEIDEVRARVIPRGSVLITCVGDLGVVSIAATEMVVNQQLHTFQCHSSINNVFLMFCLKLQTAWMYKMASATTVPYMNKTTCNSIPITLPPLPLQQKFADIVNQTEQLRSKQSQSEQELEELFQSLLQRYFG